MASPTKTYWTITDSTGNEQTFEQWGVGLGKLQRRSLESGVLTFVADGQLIDSPNLFAFQKQIVIQRNRVGTVTNPTSFSGGSIYFQGVVSKIRRIGKSNSENVQYTITDIWWYFERVTLTQVWSYGTTPHVILNILPNSIGFQVGVRSQIQAILDCVLASVPGAFTYDVSGIPNIYPPSDERKCISCAQAIKEEARWCPGLVSYVDYSGTVPKIYFVTRWGASLVSEDGAGTVTISDNPTLALPAVTLNIGSGVEVTSEDISALYDLQVPQVILIYEQTEKIGEVSETVFGNDIWPATTTNKINIFQAVLQLYGTVEKNQVGTVESTPFPPADWTAWAKAAHPFLNDCTNISINPANIVITDENNNAVVPLPYELLQNGAVHDWMSYNGVAAQKLRVHVKLLASYTDKWGNVVDATDGEELSSEINTTNLPSANYSRSTLVQAPENQPIGLAKFFWTLMNTLQFEGEIEVDNNGGEVSAQQFLGCVLNLTNGHPEWQTMNALVQGTVEDLETGIVTVTIGRNKYLDPGQLIDLLKVFRKRTVTFYVSYATYGQVQDDIQMPTSIAKKDSTRGNAKMNKAVFISPTDQTSNTFNQILLDTTLLITNDQLNN